MTCSMTTLRSNQRTRSRVIVCGAASTLHLAQALSADLFEVAVCAHAEQLAGQLTSRRPDVIVLEDSAGATAVLERIRASVAAAIPIVVLTETNDAVLIAHLLSLGAADVCHLPVVDSLFAHRVGRLADLRRASSTLACATSHLARAHRVGIMIQWWFDAEARAFRWTQDPSEHFDGLHGEGSLTTALLQWVHPDDRARVEATFASLLSHKIDYRIVTAAGEERLVTQEAEREVDEVTGRTCLVGIAQDVSRLREAERQADRLAYYDELTSLPNRAHATRFLKAAVASARRRQQRVFVVRLDLDHFRRVNDRFGHTVGNAVLKEVGARLSTALGSGHFGPFVARLDGNEFVVVFSDAGGPEEDSAERCSILAQRLALPYLIAGAEIVLSASGGVASYPADGKDVETLLTCADSAMQFAKQNGRDAFVAFDAQVRRKFERKLDVENRLRSALAQGTSLALHYQPKVELPSGHVTSVEALLRWTDASGGNISPFELVSVAEETGLIQPLGDWVLRTACMQAKVWSETLATPPRIAVNISARQFGAADFIDKLERVLEQTALSPHLLELEITEGVMMSDAEAASLVLERVKQIGLRISLDDFGTGFSSLAYLTRFPIDSLKIDRSFVVGIGVTRKSETIISAIIALSRSLGIEVVAEGVETEGQRQFLERQGPLEIQGWLFAKALPAEAAVAWIEQRARDR